MAVQYLSDNNDDGTILGQEGDKISFHGVTPVARQTVTRITHADATGNNWTNNQEPVLLNQCKDSYNELVDALVALGMFKLADTTDTRNENANSVSKGNDDGTSMSRAAHDPIGFYGHTPINRRAYSHISTADATGAYGSPEQTLLNNLKRDINDVIDDLEDSGLIDT